MRTQELRAAELLESAIRQVPVVENVTIEKRLGISGQKIDLIATVTVGNESHYLICEVKDKVEPKQARMASLQLAHFIRRTGLDAKGILIASYLSPASRSICEEHGVGFLDHEGNVRITFNGVFIEREVPNKPVTERKRLKSLFKPKSARVLKVILADPNRTWRVTDLAHETSVSLGHISNIRKALLDREIGCVNQDGFFLCNPDQLLDLWLEEYQKPAGTETEFYTTLHGDRMVKALLELMKDSPDRPDMVLASFSAANWLAPYARYGDTMLFADKHGVARLENALDLERTSSGGNIRVVELNDGDILDESIMTESGQFCTNPVQTYLDLASQGERGKEAADFLRSKLLNWDAAND